MSVKAKFKVDSITHFAGQREIRMSPVIANSEENKEWSKYTPSGQFTMMITNKEAFEQFEVGKEYLITIV